MATKKDLVEAYSFSRRRLVTAFVSGAPGGREVEPSRPGRTIVGGIALAVLMIAGAAVLGILTNRDPGDWEKVGLVSEKETGANYVILTEDGPLRPVVNITSAMLLLGPDLDKTDVGRDAIADKERGEPIGILQAPGTPPASGTLQPTGWSACTGSDPATGDRFGVKVTLTSQQNVEPTPDQGFVVRSGGRLYLVAESLAGTERGVPRAYYYEITQRNADPILRPVAQKSADDALQVPRQWLDLFTPGAPLTLASLGLDADRIGRSPAQAAPGVPDGARVGDLVVVGDTTYLVTDEPVATELDPFSLAVYQNLQKPRGFTASEIEADTRPGTIQDTGDLGINWPADVLAEKDSGEHCALLDAVEEGAPGARLASTLDGEASAAEVPAGSVERFVEPGRGAVVRVGDWDTDGAAPSALIDDRGFVYPLIGEAKSQLGYGDVGDIIVPDTWVELFPTGVELSVDAARCPPTSTERESPCAAS